MRHFARKHSTPETIEIEEITVPRSSELADNKAVRTIKAEVAQLVERNLANLNIQKKYCCR